MFTDCAGVLNHRFRSALWIVRIHPSRKTPANPSAQRRQGGTKKQRREARHMHDRIIPSSTATENILGARHVRQHHLTRSVATSAALCTAASSVPAPPVPNRGRTMSAAAKLRHVDAQFRDERLQPCRISHQNRTEWPRQQWLWQSRRPTVVPPVTRTRMVAFCIGSPPSSLGVAAQFWLSGWRQIRAFDAYHAVHRVQAMRDRAPVAVATNRSPSAPG